MDNTMLLRLAMVLQDKAPSTLDKYTCKLSLSILLDYRDGISIDELCDKINEQFKLDFTVEEISTAIQRKGSPSIINDRGILKITDKAAKALQQSDSLAEELRRIIRQFVEASDNEIDEDKLFNLLMDYLYTCFNSNVDNLLTLFDKKSISTQNAVFEASNEEIAIINEFLSWENKEKDNR